MIRNAELRDIANILKEADSILLFPHENADGDAVGSCVALCKALRELGKEASVVTGEPLSEYTRFIDSPEDEGDRCCFSYIDFVGEAMLGSESSKSYDVCLCLDCSEYKRIKGREKLFDSGKVRVCIDHHLVDQGFGDYWYIDSAEAAASQIVYKLLVELGVMNRSIANALYTGISSDTGNFKYSNTTPETLRIAANLLDIGIDHNDIIVKLYQSKDPRQLSLESKAIEAMEISPEGKVAITAVTLEMMEKCQALPEHAEAVINILRDIAGVEYAIVLKERSPELVKVSMRAKSCGNVANIAKALGGGGHVKAAGANMECSLAEAMDKVKEEIAKYIY